MLPTDEHTIRTLSRMAHLAERWIDALGPLDRPLVLARALTAIELELALAREGRLLPAPEALTAIIDRGSSDVQRVIGRLVPAVSSLLWRGHGRARRALPGTPDVLEGLRAQLRRMKAEVRSTARTEVQVRSGL
ncbi:MAG: hypothetical protein U1F43_30585 [Myxococcota bacterium]